MVAFQEELAITETAQNLAHVGSGTGLAPTLGDIGVPGFKSLPQGIANLGDQEVESHVADAFLILECVGHENQVRDPICQHAIVRFLGHVKVTDRFLKGPGQFQIVSKR